jgi:hypothetical protein
LSEEGKPAQKRAVGNSPEPRLVSFAMEASGTRLKNGSSSRLKTHRNCKITLSR